MGIVVLYYNERKQGFHTASGEMQSQTLFVTLKRGVYV